MAADVVDENVNPCVAKVGNWVIREPWIGNDARLFGKIRERYIDELLVALAGHMVARRLGRHLMTMGFGTFSTFPRHD